MERVEVPDELKFSVRTRTRWSDEDNHGVLNNAVYMTLMEEGRLAYFSGLGLMQGARFPFVLAQTNVRFIAPGRGGCEVVIGIRTVRLGDSSFEQVYRIRDAVSEAIWCEAACLLVAWDDERNEKRAMSAEFRAAIRSFEGLSE